LGRDRRALDDRKKVALNALAAHVRAVAPFAPRNLVELVEEDDARVLGTPDGLGDRLIHIDELLGLLLGQEPPRLGDPHLPALRPAWHDEIGRASCRERVEVWEGGGSVEAEPRAEWTAV